MTERRLDDAVRRAWPAPPGRGFAELWAGAAAREARRRQRVRALAAAAAVAALAVTLVVLMSGPGGDPDVAFDLRTAELLETTRWTAPSDALLPERRVDLYGELPAMIESTDMPGGPLL